MRALHSLLAGLCLLIAVAHVGPAAGDVPGDCVKGEPRSVNACALAKTHNIR